MSDFHEILYAASSVELNPIEKDLELKYPNLFRYNTDEIKPAVRRYSVHILDKALE